MGELNSYIFTSESVGAGHPDKVADLISDTILDACLEQDISSRVACETLVKDNVVVLAGEITTSAELNYDKIVRDTIRSIGYTDPSIDKVFNAETVKIINLIGKQSPDIAQGVDATKAKGKTTEEQGAGDQGIMFGYATNENDQYMPTPVVCAHEILIALNKLRNDKSSKRSKWLRPDCKAQVSVRYLEHTPLFIDSIVLSTQHTEDATRSTIEKICKQVINSSIPDTLLSPNNPPKYYINPTGKFVIGGPNGDAGLTGRKVIVDTYGGMGRHGGGAFSGKDPSKVDRSGAYMCRWVAKNIVAAHLADRCELQVSYAIGEPEPVSIYINTMGTEHVDVEEIIRAVRKTFSFKPAEIVRQLDLLKPIYKETTNYGHFGKSWLPWEETNKTDELISHVYGKE